MRRPIVEILCCWSLALAACKKSPPLQPELVRSSSVPSASAPPATALVAPPTPVTASPGAAPAPPPLPVASTAPVELALAFIEPSTHGALRLHTLQGAFLATRSGDLYRFEEGKLVKQDYDFAGEHPSVELLTLSGRYPDAIEGTAIIGTINDSQRGQWYSFATEVIHGPLHGLIADGDTMGSAWLQGSRLVYQNREFTAARAGKNAVVPRLSASPERDCESVFRLRSFEAGPDGQVVAAGPRCGGEGELMAERWESGQSEGRVSPLPTSRDLPRDAPLEIVLGAGRFAAILLHAQAMAVTWQETTEGFRELATPSLPDEYSVAVGVAGDIWLVTRSEGKNRPEAYRFAGGHWSKLVFPAEAELKQKLDKTDDPEPYWVRPNNFAIRGDLVYLAATIVKGNDRNVASAILMPKLTAASPDAESGTVPTDCTPLVVLFAVSKSTPPDYQYPATRDAIVGSPFASSAEFLEVTRAGQRTLVGKTRTMEQAKALADHVRDRIKGARPAVVCEALPEVLRSIEMR